jgi:hypothetical protein
MAGHEELLGIGPARPLNIVECMSCSPRARFDYLELVLGQDSAARAHGVWVCLQQLRN